VNDNPWEDICRRNGHVFTDVPFVISEFVQLLEQKGLPHHLFTPDEFQTCFPASDILSLGEDGHQHIVLVGRKK